MKKILFVGSINSSFIKNDYEGLKKYFDVRLYKHKFLDTLGNVIWCDTVFGWFASYRMILPTLFAKILNKKIVVVAGGYDVVNAPEIDYGAFARTPDKWISRFVFKHADVILPVSKYIANELLEKDVINYCKTELKIIYNGVDLNKFYPYGDKSDKVAITVGEINWNNLSRKGIKSFVEAAQFLPDTQFVVIGEFKDDAIDYLKSIATDNVHFTGFISNEELLTWYQVAKVYVQPSYHEGFGLSVAEAMLCECIPVTSNKGALSEVTGKKGVPFNRPKLLATAIKYAQQDSSTTDIRGRLRIIINFSLQKRIERLKEILE